MTVLWLVKGVGDVLRPADPESEEAVRRMARGEAVRVDVRRVRNIGHHRKFFALMGLLFDAQEQFTSRELFRKAVLIEAGHFDDQPLLDGTVVRTAKSIAFEACDQTEFERVYDAVVDVALAKIVPGSTHESLEDEVQAFMSRPW
jgi:hypothetical protein